PRVLPVNLGHDGGAGNPPNPVGHRTAYLWERVWAREAWMDILARFVHVERPTQGSAAARRAAETVIFPRFHQWDAVLALEAQAKVHGAGRSYLVQHSAGSGKSNTIAWVAHRLSSLHDGADAKVFDKAKGNSLENFRLVFDNRFMGTVVARMDDNEAIFKRILDDEEFRSVLMDLYAGRVYRRARQQGADANETRATE
ncbi:MAG: type I restriction endonuclease subunit R, partial [Actinomycetes bacterium]